jgi:ribose transport system ATP-binding protein
MNNICKSYFKVDVLSNASVCFQKGEIHAIVGSNGAGKSTLVKILAGIVPMDSGEILLNGKRMGRYDNVQALAMGISIANQDVHLFPHLRVYENILVGKEYAMYGKKNVFLPRKKQMMDEARALLDMLGSGIDPMRLVSKLSLGEKQMVQFAHAVIAKPEILIMDEITAGLNSMESEKIFEYFNKLRAEGCCIIYISHQLSDTIPICDKITVLRDGHIVGTFNSRDMEKQELIQMMLGRTLQEQYPRLPTKPGKEILRVNKLCNGFLKDISFNLFEGEILGIAGLLGSGRTSLMHSIAGLQKISSGGIEILEGSAPPSATRRQFGIIPDNRDEHGLYKRLSVAHNITISNLKRIQRKKLLSVHEEQIHARDMIDRLGIRGATEDQPVVYLSGGNKQKTVVGRCIYSNARIYIFDEPTKGIDVAGKVEIYNIMNELVKRGCAIVLVTSDFSELVGMCDRILVLNNGRQIIECERSKVTKEQLYSYVNITSEAH